MQCNDVAASAADCITTLDQQRLMALIERACARAEGAPAQARQILQHVRQSVVVAPEAAPRDLVTMNSTVVVAAADGRQHELTVVYPEDHDPDEACWSVFSPIGAALFGRRVGSDVDIDAPEFAGVRWQIRAMPFQPEAHGWLTM
ncbi:nucleoside diphosphate kinase regulator [Rhodocyclus tenuis]|uniref:Nucleoside diphosphate kinase regulator n=2 Tax=Rhodocyclus TaxID=1064 RepID=A0A6L5JXF1_RHOTE|nr:GreA/GreB family elongation factor [Rhodocyclus gracilis]MQY51711.1 nucleoside diphosphate kinase regulator [Rhodocyclus gracilis]MRD73191.1 nucleoside diphosphate kinase regulator [Rhodocyclus gracilis]NJA89028.1 nucleoside diphosphate kinase regulator [Rhodocyclus gracilis]